MDLKITRFPNGKLRQNCYLVSNARAQALIIDPGSEAETIAAMADEYGVRPLAILNTHGHYDHVGAVAELMGKYSIPFYLDHQDERILRSANIYKFLFESDSEIEIPEITHDLAGQPEPLVIGDFAVSTIAAPGHTPGGRALMIDGQLFTGDTLMRNTVGRTDLHGGDSDALARSLAAIMALPPDTPFHPGHGGPSTLGEASKENVPLREALS